MAERWWLTVFGVKKSRSAISALRSPFGQQRQDLGLALGESGGVGAGRLPRPAPQRGRSRTPRSRRRRIAPERPAPPRVPPMWRRPAAPGRGRRWRPGRRPPRTGSPDPARPRRPRRNLRRSAGRTAGRDRRSGHRVRRSARAARQIRRVARGSSREGEVANRLDLRPRPLRVSARRAASARAVRAGPIRRSWPVLSAKSSASSSRAMALGASAGAICPSAVRPTMRTSEESPGWRNSGRIFASASPRRGAHGSPRRQQVPAVVVQVVLGGVGDGRGDAALGLVQLPA